MPCNVQLFEAAAGTWHFCFGQQVFFVEFLNFLVGFHGFHNSKFLSCKNNCKHESRSICDRSCIHDTVNSKKEREDHDQRQQEKYLSCKGHNDTKLCLADRGEKSGQTYWQILPICPTGYGDSPYQSFSSYAGNPYMIDFDDLKEEGLLQEEEYASLSWGDQPTTVDYGLLYGHKFTVLKTACSRISGALSEQFQKFCKEQKFWLDDYALYMSIKDYHGGQSWKEWPETLQKREKDSLEAIHQELTDEILFWKKVQFLFFYQWDRLKAYAEENNVDFTLLDGQGSGENQVSQIETLIAQGLTVSSFSLTMQQLVRLV